MAIRSNSAVLDNSGLKEDGLEKGEEAGRRGTEGFDSFWNELGHLF